MISPFGYSKIFKNPLDFHIAFLRDVTEDVRFILDLYLQINKRFPSSFGEIQCGPAYYAFKFNELGIKSIAIDSSLLMIDFANSLDTKQAKKIQWLQQSPMKFSFPHVDICLLSLDSFTYFLSDEDQQQFLHSAYNCLRNGSLLIIELNHPKNIGYIDYSQIYTLSKKFYPDYSVKVEWGINNPQFNLVTGLAETQIKITKSQKGKRTTGIISSIERTNFPHAVKLMAEKCFLSTIYFLGGYSFQPLTWGSDSQLIVFQKKKLFS